MARERKPAPAETTTASTETALLEVGLRMGDRVRWHRATGGAWQVGVVKRRERDGSIGVHDARGAARAIPWERLEVRTTGPRGGIVWEPVADRAGRTEQLGMW